jgi:hypothetical protein
VLNTESLTIQDSEWSVYPNPVSDELSITTNSVSQVQLIDLTGKMVWSGQINQGTTKLSLAQLEGGVYQIVLQSAAGRSAKKIIVLH